MLIRAPVPAARAAATGRLILVAALPLALVLTLWLLALGAWVRSRVTVPATTMADAMARVARGDLTDTPTADEGTGAVAQLSGSLQEMRRALRGLVGTIRSAAAQSADMAGEISAATEQMAASGQEMSATTQHLAQQAHRQAQTVKRAADDANRILAIANALAEGRAGRRDPQRRPAVHRRPATGPAWTRASRRSSPSRAR